MKKTKLLTIVLALVMVVTAIFAIVACDINGGNEQTDPTGYTIPTGLTATVGQTLADVSLAQHSGWAWVAPTASVGEEGARTHNATYTRIGYNVITRSVSITVNPAGNNDPTPVALANAAITEAREIIEDFLATTPLMFPQHMAETQSAVREIIDAHDLSDEIPTPLPSGVVIVIVNGDFQTAIAGTATNPTGTNGYAKFIIQLTKEHGTMQTVELVYEIIATIFVRTSMTAGTYNFYSMEVGGEVFVYGIDVIVITTGTPTATLTTSGLAKLDIVLDGLSPEERAYLWGFRNRPEVNSDDPRVQLQRYIEVNIQQEEAWVVNNNGTITHPQGGIMSYTLDGEILTIVLPSAPPLPDHMWGQTMHAIYSHENGTITQENTDNPIVRTFVYRHQA
ncbi:MAG: hypothetical protein FWE22_02525 [Firmicutes bacterium]|nr:hypothetical protein [Bacillota bacterium]